MDCSDNKCLSKAELYNILKNYNFSNSGIGIPIGARMTIGVSTFNAYFNSSGLGGGIWDGWAVSNGNNGTSNRLGKFPVYYDPSSGTFSTVGSTGGSTDTTLLTSNLPSHSHSFSIPAHTHPVTDNGHTHTVNEDSQLGLFSILNNS